MRYVLSLSAAFLLMAAPLAVAQESTDKMITLKDGSVIKGKIVSVINNLYTIESASMGQVQLYDNDIVTISSVSAPRLPQAGNTQNGYQSRSSISAIDTEAIQQLLKSQVISQGPRQAGGPSFGGPGMNIPGQGNLSGIIQALMADPEVLATMDQIMKDPQMQQLMNNPEFIKSLTTLNPMTSTPEDIEKNKDLQQMIQNPEVQKLMQVIGGKVDITPVYDK